MHKDAGRPWPIICPEDDLIDYMVMEAVAIKVRREDEAAAKQAEQDRKTSEFKQDFSSLDQFRS